MDIPVVRRGDPAPPVRLPDLDGDPVDLAGYPGEPVLVLFWSPGCGYCQELLPHVLDVERASVRLRMIVISGGSVDVNRELGFASPVLLDADRMVARMFGVTATPAAVVIGSRGTVASELAQGITTVRSYVDRCHVPGSIPAPDQHGP
jgi:thiol-disulfide isomerase/thioredoxin